MAERKQQDIARFQLSTNEINSIMQSVKNIELSVEKHKSLIDNLKGQYQAFDEIADNEARQPCINERMVTTDAHDLRDGQGANPYTLPLEQNTSHPSKRAMSSLDLAQKFRREYDCKFSALIPHPIPLSGRRKAIWIGGFTSAIYDPQDKSMFSGHGNFHDNVNQNHAILSNTHFDMNSGVYTCTLSASYKFRACLIAQGRRGWTNVKVYLCRERDGLREVMMTLSNNLQPSQSMYYARPHGYGDSVETFEESGDETIEWECEKNDKVWLEVMIGDDTRVTLTECQFSGSLRKTSYE